MPTIHTIGTVKVIIRAAGHPLPHIHARNEDGTEAVIQISDLSVRCSDLPLTALRDVLDWMATKHEWLALQWLKINDPLW